jgi:hypothetical protein
VSRLLDAGATAELIREQHASIQRDRNVRDISAVLVKRLAEHVHVRLSSRPTLNPETKSIAGSLERIRRNTSKQPDAQRVGDCFAPESASLVTAHQRREAEIKGEYP